MDQIETNLRRVARGLLFIYLGIQINLLAILAIMLIPFLLLTGIPVGGAAIPILLFVGSWGPTLFVAGFLINLVGVYYCLDTPEETGAQNLIYAAAACWGVNLLCSVIAFANLIAEV